jgi:hypothetical protein
MTCMIPEAGVATINSLNICSLIWDSHSGSYEEMIVFDHNVISRLYSTGVLEEHAASSLGFRGLCLLIIRPWRWRRHVIPKRLSAFNGIRSVISQRIEVFKCSLLLWAWNLAWWCSERRWGHCLDLQGEITGWRQFHMEELHNLQVYSSRNTIMVIIWRRLTWAGHVARMHR